MTIQANERPLPGPAWLRDPIAEYRPGDFLMSGTAGSILGRGSRRLRMTADTARQELADHCAATSQPSAIAGVLPFRPGGMGEFIALDSTLRGPRLHAGTAPHEGGIAGHGAAMAADSLDHHYTTAVAKALKEFSPEGLQKVVLARSLRTSLASPLDIAELFARLVGQNPSAYVFAAPLPEGRTLVGASPELLVRRSGSRAISNPLAGSMPRCADSAADQANARKLLGSSKDLREHAIVVDMVAEVLSGLCTGLRVPAAPELVRTGSMWHLSTHIEGRLREEETTSLDLAFALHPTPAVCGWPTAAACSLIEELEETSRGFYAGAVGWMDAQGDGEWAVSIRCAEIASDELRVHAGAGIVPGSDPELEHAETEAKFRTILAGLGVC